MNVLERIDQVRDDIEKLESEAAVIVEQAANEGREPSGAGAARLTEILGEDRAGTHADCELAKLYASLKEWQQIHDGMAKRAELVALTTPPAEPHISVIERERFLPPREFAMGCSRKVIVPQDARFNTHNLECWWGDTRAEREEAAYAAGMWFIATLWSDHPDARHKPITSKAKQWCVDHGLMAQQQTGDDGKGGYLVPKPLERAVIEVREMYGVMRRNARIYPMESKTLDIPKFSTGLQVGLVAELAAQPLTEKAWTQIPLVSKKAGGYAQWSTEVGEDAVISLASDLARDFGIAIAEREDYTGFMGDGTVDFANMGITGIVNALDAGATLVLAGGNTSVTDITLQDFEGLLGKIPNVVTNNLRWFMHKSTYYAAVHPLKTQAGGNTIATLTDGDPLSAGSDFRWLGVEGVWTNVLPTSAASAGTKGVVILGDLSRGVAFGDRRGVTIQVSEHVKLIEDAMIMTGNTRFDVNVHEVGDASDAGVIAQIQLAAA